MKFRFDNDQIDGDIKCKLVIEYILVKRSKMHKENGIKKEYSYVAVVGHREYLETKSLNMVYTESRDVALNIIVHATCMNDSNFVIVSEMPIIIDPESKMSKRKIGILFYVNLDKLCEHLH